MNRPKTIVRKLAIAISACFAGSAFALPTGPNVVSGSASIAQNGNVLTITNSNNAILDWQKFGIAANEIVRFNQASASSSVLNRVVGADPTQIYGQLLSNGRVWVINPAGVMVGPGGMINTAGFVASTLNISNQDFLAGRLNFQATPGAGSVVNQGSIVTPSGGTVYLVGANVANEGSITTPNGEAILAAGQTVSLIDTATPGVKVEITGTEGKVTNLGEIAATAGRIGMAGVLVKNAGTLNASSVVSEGGRIFLRATRKIELADTSRISADGVKGGSVTAVTEADGKIAGELVARGTLSAQGNGTKGSGGFVETSAAKVDLNGVIVKTRGGMWLIDPMDFTIGAGGDITGAALAAQLDDGDVAILSSSGGTSGNGDIFINDDIAVDYANSGNGTTQSTLTLQAERNISLAANKSISASNGALGVNLFADVTGGNSGAIKLNTGASISSNGGNVTLAGGDATGSGYARGNSAQAVGIILDGASIAAGNGHVVLRGKGFDSGTSAHGVTLINGAQITTTGGDVTITGYGGTFESGSARGIAIGGTSGAAATVSTGTGTLTLTGYGGYDGDGVQVRQGSQVVTTTGGLNITGFGGSTGSYTYGVYIRDSGTMVQSAGGEIVINATSLHATGTSNRGFVMDYSAGVKNTGAGNITITGHGGADGDGLKLWGGTLEADSGTITLVGDALTGSSDIYLDSTASITTHGGALSLSGIGADKYLDLWGAIASNGGNIGISANDINIDNTINAGAGAVNLTTSGNIYLGSASGTGVNISGAELQNITASTLSLTSSVAGHGIAVNGVTAAQSGNIGLVDLNVPFWGDLSFGSTKSYFNALTGKSNSSIHLGGDIETTVGNLVLRNAMLGSQTMDDDFHITAATTLTSAGDIVLGNQTNAILSSADFNLAARNNIVLNIASFGTGNVTLTATNGNVDVGTISTARANVADTVYSGNVEISAAHDVRFTQIDTSLDNFGHSSGTADAGHVTINAGGNIVSTLTNIGTTAVKTSSVTNGGYASGSGGAVTLTAGGDILLPTNGADGAVDTRSDSRSAGAVAGNGGAIRMSAGGRIVAGALYSNSYTDEAGTAGAGGLIALAAGKSLRVGTINTGSSSGTNTSAVAASTGNGGDVRLSAASGDIQLDGDIVTASMVAADGTDAGTITSATVGAGGNITLTAGGKVAGAGRTLDASSWFNSTTGKVTGGTAAGAGSITVRAIGNVAVGNVDAHTNDTTNAGGKVAMYALGGDLTANDINTSSGNSAGNVTLYANGTVTANSVSATGSTGGNLAVVAANIAIGSKSITGSDNEVSAADVNGQTRHDLNDDIFILSDGDVLTYEATSNSVGNIIVNADMGNTGGGGVKISTGNSLTAANGWVAALGAKYGNENSHTIVENNGTSDAIYARNGILLIGKGSGATDLEIHGKLTLEGNSSGAVLVGQANRDIVLTGVTVAGGATAPLNVKLEAGRNLTATSSAIRTYGGSIGLKAGNAVSLSGSTLNADASYYYTNSSSGGAIGIKSSAGDITFVNTQLTATGGAGIAANDWVGGTGGMGGTIIVSAAGNLNLDGSSAISSSGGAGGASAGGKNGGGGGGGGAITLTAGGNLGYAASIASTGGIGGAASQAKSGNGGLGGSITLTAGIDITADTGSSVSALGGAAGTATGSATAGTAGNGGGNIVLRADSAGTGVGTVTFTDTAALQVFTGGSGRTDIYYNPSSYLSPTSFDVVSGNSNAWMLVNDATSLQAMGTNLAGSYALGKDIDASGIVNFNPIGDMMTAFTGELDGLGHTVYKLTIDRASTDYVGLFGVVGSGVSINNVGISDANIVGRHFVGALMGRNSGGSISSSYSSGTVRGTNFVGGLVGYNASGTIADTYSTASVSGTDGVGGLAGANGGSIATSYATGAVTGTTNVGGFAGINQSGGTIASSFWDIDTTGQSVGYAYNTGAAITSLAEVRSSTATVNAYTQATYADFDFSGTWWLSEDNTRPMLRSEHQTTLTNAHQLQLMALDLDASYTLARNIDASGTINTANHAADVWKTATGFVPVGEGSLSFGGSLDGLGHSISGLTIDRTGDFVGLFSSTDLGSTIKNLGLENANIAGASHVGGLAGKSYGSIAASYVSGSVTVSGSGNNVGGLVGTNEGSISDSHASASVSGAESIGGLVGLNNGAIALSYVSGSVTASGNNAGGLAGYNAGSIATSYTTGYTHGGLNYSGGLVGYNAGSGTIGDSYALGAVLGDSDFIGGLVGYSDNATANAITRTYSTGHVSAANAANRGGLIGGAAAGGVSNSYWDVDTSGMSTSPAGTGIHSADAFDGANYSNFNFSDTWWLSAGNTRPILRGEYSTTITNAHQLQLMALAPAASYTLAADIDASATAKANGVWNAATGFLPVGDDTIRFTGTFSGGGHSIFGLTINRASDNYIGLFGYVDGGSISNVGLLGGSITGGAVVGGLVGSLNNGSVSGSYNTGNVTGTIPSYVGGLVGDSESSTITNSYTTGKVSGVSDVGGLVGGNGGTISNSFSSSTVNGYSYVGGIAGTNTGTIQNSHGSGNVSGTDYVGGLVGTSTAGTITASYASGTVSGALDVGGLVGYNAAAISDSYASGAVTSGTAVTDVGGLVGSNAGSISRTYASGAVSGNSSGGHIGGLVGTNTSTGTISDSYWDTDTTGSYVGYAANDHAGGITNLVDVRSSTSTVDAFTEGTYSGFNFSSTWWLSANNTRPILRSEYSTTLHNGHQLQLMALDTTASYTLAKDVDLAETSRASGVWNSATGFIPVGTFSGSFDGGGHTIAHLAISRGTDNVGLFGDIDATGVVKNVGVIDANISGGNNVGVLAGTNSGSIGSSYVSGAISGTGYIGGLVGYNALGGRVADTYSLAAVSGSASDYGAGGLVGRNNGTVTTSHAAGTVSGVAGAYTGGLVGTNASSGTITASVWDIEATGQANSYGTGSGTISNLQGVRTWSGEHAWAFAADSYTGFDFDNTWWLFWGNTRPMLRSEYQTTITNAHQLQLMAINPNANYVLSGNIDASGTTKANDVWSIDTPHVTYGFAPIGGFGGNFDGLGRTISGLTIASNSNNVGLFGSIDSGGSVRNVGLLNAEVITAATANFVGTLAGDNLGSISNVYVAGRVAADGDAIGGLVGRNLAGGSITASYAATAVSIPNNHSAIGGLVGRNEGAISASGATGSVTAALSINVGGLVGENIGAATITDSHALGSVGGYDTVGGLVGLNDGTATVTHAYSTGQVSAASDPAYAIFGGLIGSNSSSQNSFADSYYDTETSGASGLGTGKTTAELMAALPSGFSASTWAVVAGTSYPYLKAIFSTGVQVFSGTYSGHVGTQQTEIALATNGSLVGGGSVGANGFWYSMLRPTTVASGDKLLAWSTNSAERGGLVTPAVAGNNTGLDFFTDTLTLAAPSGAFTNATLLTALGELSEGNIPYVKSAGSSLTLGYYVDKLLFRGGANFTIVDDANLSSIATIAAAGVGSLNYSQHGKDIQVGTVGGSSGITSTGGVTLASDARTPDTVSYFGGGIKILDGIQVSGATISATAAGGNITLESGASLTSTSASAGNNIVLITSRVNAGGGNFVNNSTSSALSTTAGRWLIYSTDPTPNKLGGLAYDFSQYNATSGTTVLGAGNGLLFSLEPAAQTVTLGGSTSRAYNGSDATVTDASGLSLGVATNDYAASITATANYVFSDANLHVGTGKEITASGINVSSALDADSKPVYGLSFGSSALANVGAITPAQLTATASIVGTTSRSYNGTTAASGATLSGTVSGGVGGDTFTLDTSGVTLAYSNKHVDATIGATGTVGFAGATNATGWTAGDYVLSAQPTIAATGEITPVHLTATASIGGTTTKPYDGTTSTSATLSGTLTGGIGGDTFALNTSDVTLAYSNQHVGATIGATGSVHGVGVNNATGWTTGDYVMGQPTIAAVGSITPAQLTASIVGTPSKTYDGTTAATLTGASYSISGLVGSESFSVTKTSGSYNDKNVATANTVSTTLAGGDFVAGNGALASDYALPTSATGAATITPAPVSVVAVDPVIKTYSGNNDASMSAVLTTGLVAGDSVATTATLAFLDPNVGTGKTVRPSGLVVHDGVGADMTANYNISYVDTTNNEITRKALTTSLTGSITKTYDGTTTATIGGGNYALSGFVAGQSASVTKTGAVGAYNSKDVLTATTATVTLAADDYSAGAGTLLSNYSLPTSASGTATITPATLTASLTGTVAKTYDGGTSVSIAAANVSLAGIFGSDSVSGTGTGTYNDRHVGSGKTVTGSFGLTGSDAGNYTLASSAFSSSNGSITQLASVAWTGGTTGNWSLASNWAGGALPDAGNVAAVTIPAGTTVTFDAATAATTLDTLNVGSNGGVVLAGSTLGINNSLTTPSYAQTGGTLNGNGSFTVTESFSKTGGLFQPGGTVNITQASGDLSFVSDAAITFGTLVASNGNIAIDNTGGITTGDGLISASGSVSMIAHSPITIGGGGIAAGNGIALAATTASADSAITLNGALASTGGDIGLAAYGNIAQNANISTGGAGNIGASSSSGNITMGSGAQTTTAGGSIGLAATNGNITLTLLNAGTGAVNLDAGGSIAAAAGTSGANIIGGTATLNAGGNITLKTQVQVLNVDAGGSFSITDAQTGTTLSNVVTASNLTDTQTTIQNATDDAKDSLGDKNNEATASPPTTTTSSGSTGLTGGGTQTIGGDTGNFGGSDTSSSNAGASSSSSNNGSGGNGSGSGSSDSGAANNGSGSSGNGSSASSDASSDASSGSSTSKTAAAEPDKKDADKKDAEKKEEKKEEKKKDKDSSDAKKKDEDSKPAKKTAVCAS